MELQGKETLTGIVEEIIFQNAANGYTVMDFSTENEMFTAVGVMPGLAAGETVTLTGSFTVHPSFGRQLKVEAFSRCMPETEDQIFKYLSSGVIHGIGAKKAAAIIKKFGADTLNIIENEPQRLAQIKGISEDQAKNIGEEFKKQYAVRTVMLELEKYGFSPSECIRIYKYFGINAAAQIKENPYILCAAGLGIGFERAEAVEEKLENKPAPDCRLKEGILHIMRHNRNMQGHTCIPREKLLPPAASFLGIRKDEADDIVNSLISTAQLKSENIENEEFLFLPSCYKDEKRIAERMAVVAAFPPPKTAALSDMIDDAQKVSGIVFEELQRKAVAIAGGKGLLILTGGPGTGKTTTIKGIINVFERQNLEIALAAPTGRAAKRMTEVTGVEAKTIHRLLEVEWDEDDKPTFRRNAKNPLDCNALILDELSMVDISVFASLLDALPLGCRLVLVGDSDQLPPVGAGNVLHDLIISDVLPVVELTAVKRQALSSKIITNAHKIVKGEIPDLKNDGTDFFHMERSSAARVAETVTELCVSRLKNAYSLDPFADIQVICPSKKGEAGTLSLNRLLQEALNPKEDKKSEIIAQNRIFRSGDKVMQVKNNYNIEWESDTEKGLGIFNGDIGIIKNIDIKNGTVTVDFDGRTAELAPEHLSDLELAYAVTVHKSQGSEFNAVIIPVFGTPPKLAYRNLLYTAVTRAKNLLITVGSSSLIAAMTENDKKAKRYSALPHFLKSEF